jgi:hypothetical protein
MKSNTEEEALYSIFNFKEHIARRLKAHGKMIEIKEERFNL